MGHKSTSMQSRLSVTGTSLWGSEEERARESEEGHYINTSRIMPPCPIRPITLQLSPNIGLHIQSQAEVAITFFAEGHQTRLNIGVLYNPYDKLEVSSVGYPTVLLDKTRSALFLQNVPKRGRGGKTFSGT